MGDQGPEQTVTGEDVLTVMRDRDRDTDPVVTVSQLADELPVTHRTVNNRLGELEAAGRVKSKQAGRSKVWWPSDEKIQLAECQEKRSDREPTAVADGTMSIEDLPDRDAELQNEIRSLREDVLERIERIEEKASAASASSSMSEGEHVTIGVSGSPTMWAEHTRNLAIAVGLFTFGVVIALLSQIINLPESIIFIAGLSIFAGPFVAVFAFYRIAQDIASSATDEPSAEAGNNLAES